MAPFLFLFTKAALTSLSTDQFVTLKPLFRFWKVLSLQVFSLKPAPFYKLSAGLSSTNKSATSLLLSFSHIHGLSSPLCSLFRFSFYLKHSWQIWQELSSLCLCAVRLQLIPRDSFLPGNHAAEKLARRGTLLLFSSIPCNLSFLTSRIHSFFFLGLKTYGLI